MNAKFSLAILAILVLLCNANACEARFMQVQVKKVPITRLLTNLEARAKSSATSGKDRAMLEFQIGRLHAMAYAAKTEDVSVRQEPSLIPAHQKGPIPKDNLEPFFGYAHNDFMQFELTKAPDAAAGTKAQEHLKLAMEHLRKAVELDGSLYAAKLGLAWCLDQSGQAKQAIPLYRQVFAKSFEDEKNGSGLRGTSVVEETGDYLLKLLDPKTDAKEIAEVTRKKEQVQKNYRAVTPIVVALKPGINQYEMMKRTDVRFDLDGNGERVNRLWPAANAGWLVYDASGNGRIESGLELFGPSTFWIFWRDGYEALSALDDDRNGLIDGKELCGLAVWQDQNYNGKADTDEVKSLPILGIEALSCRSRIGANGFLHNPSGVRFVSGEVGETVDWIVE